MSDRDSSLILAFIERYWSGTDQPEEQAIAAFDFQSDQ